MSRDAAAGDLQRCSRRPIVHRRQESKHVLLWIQRCVWMIDRFRLVSCDAANADQLCRTGSVCARPALTSRAQTQSAVLPRSCSNRSCRLLASASVPTTHAQRIRALKVLVPPGSRQPLRPRLQHGRCCAYTATPFYSILYSKNAAVYAYTADAHRATRL